MNTEIMNGLLVAPIRFRCLARAVQKRYPCQLQQRQQSSSTDYDEQALHEDIPQRGDKEVLSFAGRKRANCAVYGAGLATTGALAIGQLITSPNAHEIIFRPKRIPRMDTRKIRYVAAGCGFSLFASRKELYGAGLNNFYQIGGPRRSNVPTPGQALHWYIDGKRIMLPAENGEKIQWISAGRMHSVVLTQAQKFNPTHVYCMGSNTHGQCGFDPVTDPFVTHDRHNVLRPVKMPTDEEIWKVHACLDTTFALSRSGKLYAWGLGTDGQLGNGNAEIQWQPELVGGDLAGERISHIGGSTDTLLAISDKGDLFAWGQNEYGQLGSLTDEPQVFHPTHVPFKLGKLIDAAATGSSCIVCNSDGEAFSWGSEVLGFGPAVRRLDKPMLLDPPLFASAARDDDHKVARVYAGGCAMAALTESGHMFSWGANRQGLLALSHKNHQYFPYQISFAESARTASFGPNHSLFVTNRF